MALGEGNGILCDGFNMNIEYLFHIVKVLLKSQCSVYRSEQSVSLVTTTQYLRTLRKMLFTFTFSFLMPSIDFEIKSNHLSPHMQDSP